MKGITKEGVKKDMALVRALFQKYSDAIWEEQTPNSAHFDQQQKLVKICMCDIRQGLFNASESLRKLDEIGFVEEEVDAETARLQAKYSAQEIEIIKIIKRYKALPDFTKNKMSMYREIQGELRVDILKVNEVYQYLCKEENL